MISNHIVMPSLLKGAEIAFSWLFKGDEPDEEDFESWLKLMASGPLSGLVILGMIFTNERHGDVTAPTLSGVNRVTRSIGKLSGDVVNGDWTKLGEDTNKTAKAFIPLYRDLSNFSVRVYYWLFGGDEGYDRGY